jgi:hypothetical protein
MVNRCLPIAALPPADSTKVVECAAFARPCADIAENRQRLLVVGGGLDVLALPPREETEIPVRAGFPRPVAGLAENQQGLLVPGRLLRGVAKPPAHLAEIDKSGRFGAAVAGAARGVEGMRVDRDGVCIVAAGDEIAGERGRQPGGVAGPAVGGGVRGHGDQHDPLRIQPGACLVWTGHRRGCHGQGRRGHVRPAVLLGGRERLHRGGGGGEVIIKQPGQCRLPFFRSVLGFRG